MKFSDQFLESYAALFGKEGADSFLMRNLDNYVSPSEAGKNAENEKPETSDQPETMASESDPSEDKKDKG